MELAANPKLGKLRDDIHAGLRMHLAGKHLIFYFVTDYGIDVVRVLHERMDITQHLS